MSPGFVRGLIERARGKDLVVESVFPSREDLLTNFQFLGMTIEEMWPDLDYFGPAYYFSDIGYLYSVLKGVWFF